MKKLLSIILIISLAVLSFVYSEMTLIDVVAKEGAQYEIINNEDYQVVKMSLSDYSKIINTLDLEIVSNDDVSGREIIEGYTSKLNDYVTINNRKVNIQISITDDYVLVGYPLIKNSF